MGLKVAFFDVFLMFFKSFRKIRVADPIIVLFEFVTRTNQNDFSTMSGGIGLRA